MLWHMLMNRDQMICCSLGNVLVNGKIVDTYRDSLLLWQSFAEAVCNNGSDKMGPILGRLQDRV